MECMAEIWKMNEHDGMVLEEMHREQELFV